MSSHTNPKLAGDDSARPRSAYSDPLRAPQVPGLAVVRLLGVGGRAAVWLVRPTGVAQRSGNGLIWVAAGDQLPQELALKIPLVRPRTVMSLRNSRQELEAMLPLAHDHVVRAWGLVRSGASSGVLMDAYPAGSLAQLLRSSVNPMAPGAVVTSLMPIASALEHLHRLGASHGDVTAANILLSSEGRPALADLGDSALLGMSSAPGSPAEDISALAGVAWRALTGREPESGSRRAPLGALRPDVPPRLAVLLEECFAADAADRPRADEFAVELYASADPVPLRLIDHVDDEALAELPTQLPERRESGPLRWTGLLKRLSFRSAGTQRPSCASKFPSSKRAFRVWRKRPASAPSTIR